jgi:anaphase-promoting complex subunit 1
MCVSIELLSVFNCSGGGSSTIGNDNRSIAALVAALYPRYPLNTTDNRYHLQAFRHLYVLAVQPRCVEAIDVDTGMSCYVPLEVILKVPSFALPALRPPPDT